MRLKPGDVLTDWADRRWRIAVPLPDTGAPIFEVRLEPLAGNGMGTHHYGYAELASAVAAGLFTPLGTCNLCGAEGAFGDCRRTAECFLRGAQNVRTTRSAP